MPSPFDAITTLLSGPSNGGADAREVARRREANVLSMKRSLYHEDEDPRHTFSGATPYDVQDEQEKIDNDPSLGLQAQKESTAAFAAMLGSRLQGFNSPQEGAAYTREAERHKVDAPLAVEQAKMKGNLDLEDRSNQHKIDRFKEMKDLMTGGAPGAGVGGRPLERVAMNVNAEGDPSMSMVAGQVPKLTAQEKQISDSVNATRRTVDQVNPLLEKRNPGIAQDPDKYGSIFDKAPNFMGSLFYRGGVKSPFGGGDDPTIRQLMGFIKINATRAMTSGRMTQYNAEMAQQHLPDDRFSDGENYRRIQVLKDLIGPSLLEGIEDTRHGGASGSPDPFSDPNWGR